jgi:exo-poly-alpha-galacturonosidase
MKNVLPFLIFAMVAVSKAAPPTRWLITDHGAIGDGATLNTQAIQGVIDQCAAAGGGVLVVPEGVFLSGAIFFKQGVNLLIENNGVLKGTTNGADYPLVNTRWEGVEREWRSAFLNFFDLHDVEFTGEGTVDGSGNEWQALFGRRNPPPVSPALTPAQTQNDPLSSTASPSGAPDPNRGRPRLIAVERCKDVHISGLHLKNQASWGLFMVYSENVLAENLVIRAEHNIPSSDGMDIDSCRSVRISGCDIDCNDDCISIKSGKGEDGFRVNRPCEDILIEKTRFGYGHGGVAVGSEVSGGIRRIEVRDCLAEAGNWAPVRIKSQPSRGGFVEDIVFRNLELRGTRQAVEFNLEWRMVPPLPPPAESPTRVRNIRLIHLTGTVASVGVIHGLPASPITDVKFENCQLKAQNDLVLINAQDIDTTGLTVELETK